MALDFSDAEALGAFHPRVLGWDITARDGAAWLQLRDPNGGVGLNLQAEDWYRPPVWSTSAPVPASSPSRPPRRGRG
jgi:hypothetical protein